MTYTHIFMLIPGLSCECQTSVLTFYLTSLAWLKGSSNSSGLKLNLWSSHTYRVFSNILFSPWKYQSTIFIFSIGVERINWSYQCSEYQVYQLIPRINQPESYESTLVSPSLSSIISNPSLSLVNCTSLIVFKSIHFTLSPALPPSSKSSDLGYCNSFLAGPHISTLSS